MTVRCLESISQSSKLKAQSEIVVVDNGSEDDSVRIINEFSGLMSLKEKKSQPVNSLTRNRSIIKLIQNKENLGYAEGNNVGIRYALDNGADYVCLLNNDTRVSEDFLSELVKVAESDKKIGVVGGKIYFEKGYEFHKERYKPADLGKVIWYAGGLIDWQNVYAGHRGVDEVDHGQYDLLASHASSHPFGSEPQVIGSEVAQTQGGRRLARLGMETEYVNGCLMLVKREVLEKVGVFDPKFFMYLEDTDFCQRAKKAGFKIFYAPKALIWHLNAGSSGPGSNLHDYFITRNRLLFGLRWAPLKAKIALIKESVKFLIKGRKWQKIGVRDFWLGRFGKGSWNA